MLTSQSQCVRVGGLRGPAVRGLSGLRKGLRPPQCRSVSVPCCPMAQRTLAAGCSSKPMLTPGPRKGVGLGSLGPVYALQTHLTSVTPLLWMDLTASSMRLCLWSLASQSLGVLFKNPFNPGPRPP